MEKLARVALVGLLCSFVVMVGCGVPEDEVASVTQALSQHVPMQWEWLPHGHWASAWGTTTACDGDVDVYLRYDGVTSIDSDNTVHMCVGKRSGR